MDELENCVLLRLMGSGKVPEAGDENPEAVKELSRRILSDIAMWIITGEVPALRHLTDAETDRVSQRALFLVANAVKEYQDLMHGDDPDYVPITTSR